MIVIIDLYAITFINLLFCFCHSCSCESISVLTGSLLLIFAIKAKTWSHFPPFPSCAVRLNTTNNFTSPPRKHVHFLRQKLSHKIACARKKMEKFVWEFFCLILLPPPPHTHGSVNDEWNLMNFSIRHCVVKRQLFERGWKIIKFNFIVSDFRLAHCRESTKLWPLTAFLGQVFPAEMASRTDRQQHFQQTNFSQDFHSCFSSLSMAWKQTAKEEVDV